MRDNYFFGAVLGVICPLLAYLATTFTELQAMLFAQKPIALYVIAAVINLIAVRFIYRSGREATAKGIILVTFLAMVVLVVGLRIKA